MIDIVILGANGALGLSVTEYLEREDDINLILVSRNISDDKGKLFWDYDSIPPEQIIRADFIINCARSQDYWTNLKFNKTIVDTISAQTKYINISSNAIFARPNGYFSNLFFKGDAYIREKKAIEEISLKRKNTYILRPSVVLDEGNWRTFFESCKTSEYLYGPKSSNNSKIKVTCRAEVSQSILDIIRGNQNITEEIYHSIVTVNELTEDKLISKSSDRNYYQSFTKNIFLSLLNSFLLPDRLVYFLQRLVLKNQSSIEDKAIQDAMIIEGMTRLYLFGKHTKL